jgi:hypothetical protein
MYRQTLVPALFLLCAGVLLAACSNISGMDEWERRIGVIEIGGGQPAPVQLPASIRQGVPATVIVTTYGSGSCLRPAGARVIVNGLRAEVVPYDSIAVRGVCTDDLKAYPREVRIQFESAGEALVRVRGQTLNGTPAEFETRVVVQP